MNKIFLTEQEIEVIQLELKDEIDIWSEPEKLAIVCDVIKRAEALMEELDAYDELNGDLLRWYWNKYQAQETATTEE